MKTFFIYFIKFISKIVSLFIYIIAFLLFILIILLYPFIKIRVGPFRSDVIGNSFFNLEFYLSKKKITKSKFLDLFFPTTNIFPNKYFKIIAKRNIHFNQFFKFIYFYFKLFSLNNFIVEMVEDKKGSRDTEGILNSTTSSLFFNENENSRAIKILNKLGIKNNKFVCLINRDNAYKDKYQKWITNDWSYHEYRNAPISTYLKSVKFLVSNNIYVIRMGKETEGELDFNHPYYFDYSKSKFRSDFLDLWLMSKCFFCISSGTGLDDVAIAFRKPIAHVNCIPIGANRCNQSTILIAFKKIINNNTGKPLFLSEIIKKNLIYSLKSDDYSNSNVSIINNTEDEIYETVRELKYFMDNNWIYSDYHLKLNKLFWKQMITWKDYDIRIGKLNPKSGISFNFLKNNNWLLK